MPFLTGSVTYLRFRVDGPKPDSFGEDAIAALRTYAAGRQRLASADGIECGWAASKHVLDTAFELEKNICNDALLFDLRVDTEKLPADMLKAYYEIELKALSANNPSGFASMRQKREAKEAARDRLEDEGKDGRFKKRKCIPVMWDRTRNEVLFGTTSVSNVSRLQALFKQTFGCDLVPIVAGHDLDPTIVSPSVFIPNITPESYAWIADDRNVSWLGNEFMLWLWFNAAGESDTVELADNSDLTYMISRALVLECPRGIGGVDGFKHEGPTRLPEALRAIRSGKLPRKCGLILVRHDEQYELTLHAESLAVGSAKLPAIAEDIVGASEKRVARIDQVRHMVETLDLLYEEFTTLRLSEEWFGTLGRITKWLTNTERREAA